MIDKTMMTGAERPGGSTRERGASRCGCGVFFFGTKTSQPRRGLNQTRLVPGTDHPGNPPDTGTPRD